MSRCPFDQLPNEILLHVFVKGVENERPESGRGSFRGMKTFAHLARRVCARWKTIIENPPSRISFRIAYLVLYAFKLDKPDKPSFAKQLATFHRLLVSSDGCDLVISFQLFELSQEMGNNISPYTSAIIRLAIHAMEMTTPYLHQVIELSVYHTAPVVYLRLLRLVATHWASTSRLVAVVLGVSTTKTDPNSNSLPGYDKIRFETSGQDSFPLSLAHVRSLDTLAIPASPWMYQGFILPPNLQHLELTVSNDGELFKLLGFLQIQTNTFESLRSIRIQKIENAEAKPADQSDKQEQMKRPKEGSLGPINLRFLRRIVLDRFTVRNVQNFLGLLCCRSLEDLSLNLIGHEEIDQNSLLIDFPSKFPRLTITKLETTVKSWQSLYNLEVLANLPIQQLSVSFEGYERGWIDHLDAFCITLSQLRLQALVLQAPYWVTHHLIASVDTQSLTNLVVVDSSRDPNFERVAPMDQKILAPHLKDLLFEGGENHFVHMLSQLEATQLATLEARPQSIPTGWDREKALQMLSTKSFTSMRSAYLHFLEVNDPLLPHLTHLFPNLRELWVTIKKRTGDDDAILSLIRDVLQPLRDTLSRTIPAVSFPHLCSIFAYCSSTVLKKGNKQSTKWPSSTREEVRRMLQEMLTSRAKAGGSSLQIESIHFVDGSEHAITNVTFEAREAPSVIETNSSTNHS